MSGFRSFVLEPHITFEASPINLAGSTADWTPVQSDDANDNGNDSQSAARETELVGDANHSLLYGSFDTNGTDTETDDEIGFRLRVGAANESGGFGELAVIGTDANNDGVIDLFLAFDGRTTPGVSLFAPGPGANRDTPVTTSLQNPVAAAGAETDVSLVDAATDPTATDADLDNDGNTDAFVSFKILFSSLKDQLNDVAGISITKDSPLRFVAFTTTQEAAIDGDISGIDGGNASAERFDDLGVFSKATIPANLSDTGSDPTATPSAPPDIVGGANTIVSIPENTTVVKTVEAGSNPPGAAITFGIGGGTHADLFSVDPDSGVLTFNEAPNFEGLQATGVGTFLSVIVTAEAGGETSQQLINVIVTDQPEPLGIDSNGGAATATVDVPENTTEVTTVVASSGDGNITYDISGGTESDQFTIDEISGVLSFINAPDFESGITNFQVQVRATDDGGNTDTQLITVRVTNTNDAPTITATNTTAVTTVTASDDDAVTFSIVDELDGERFQIDPTTGALSFVVAPDFETPNSVGGGNDYVVTVRASDGSGGTATQQITVSVSNTNEAPAITSNAGDPLAVNVTENTTDVTTVTASDEDGDAVTFSIVDELDGDRFRIDPASGALTFAAAPDFESPNSVGGGNDYVVTVQASDSSGGTATQQITVSVDNANDAPTITSNAGNPIAVDVAENTTDVATVAASDEDGDTARFAIVPGADAAAFTIDPDTGILQFAAAPNFEAPTDTDGDNIYVVTVEARDPSGSTDTQTITATVTDVTESTASGPEVIPDTGTGGSSSGSSGGTAPGTGSVTGDTGGTGLITGVGEPAPPPADLTPPADPAPEAAPEAPAEAPAEQASETAGESLSDAAAEALAETLANLAPAAGPGSGGGSNDTDAAREQTAAIEAQQREELRSLQSNLEQGPTLLLDAGIPDTLFESDSSFTFRLPDNVFTIVGSDGGLLSDLSMEATLGDGSPLPEWLIFDPERNEFRGTAPAGGELTFEIRITATDLVGNQASASFQFIVEPAETGESENTDAAPTGNPQQSALPNSGQPDSVLTVTPIEAENAENQGGEPLPTGAPVTQATGEVPAKPSLSGQIKETGFGKFRTDALQLAFGRSG